MAKMPELGLRKLTLFRHLGYDPHPAQLLVHKSHASRRVVACGVRFGKSTVGVYETVAALLHPRERALGWLVAPTYEVTKRIAERVVAVLQAHMPHRIVKLDARERSITVANLGGGESVLRARSADRPVSLLGESLDFLVVDEAAQIDGRVWNEHLAPRLLDRGGWCLLLSTPDGPGWFRDEFRRGEKDPDYAAWSFPTAENPIIAAELIAAERKRLPEETFRAQYLADFIGSEIEPCESCGAPDPVACSMVICRDGEEPAHCPDCGDIVHDDGRTAVPLWSGKVGRTTVIHIQPGLDEPPPMP